MSTSDSVRSRLSTGTGAFNILGPRRWYYIIGLFLMASSVLIIGVKGFNLGIDFAGGSKLAFDPPAGQSYSNSEIAGIVSDATGSSVDTVQSVGSSIQVTMRSLQPDQVSAAKQALTTKLGLSTPVSDSAVSGTWGAEVSKQALISVLVFLLAVALFIWIRFERKAAIAAVASTVQVMIITAGIYALIGFELTPATVIGLLTILGFSLYDVVVVFDKVQENTRGLTAVTRRNYEEAANMAVNQTVMRSINTTIIALLPVIGLLVAGVAILGSGTLKDLALVQMVGMIVAAYSSLFVAVPLGVDLRLRESAIRAHTARVAAKRDGNGLTYDAVGDPVGRSGAAVLVDAETELAVAAASTGLAARVSKPLPGVRPDRAKKTPSGQRPTGKRARQR